MATRSANARWEGTLKEGTGNLKVESGAVDVPFSFSTRFEDGVGTNPEEMLAAAHAGCFSMQLNNDLRKEGHEPTFVDTNAAVAMRQVDGILTITTITLTVEAEVPGLDEATFTQFAEEVKKNCLISRALNVAEMDLVINFKG